MTPTDDPLSKENDTLAEPGHHLNFDALADPCFIEEKRTLTLHAFARIGEWVPLAGQLDRMAK